MSRTSPRLALSGEHAPELTARLFTGLYTDYDLIAVDGTNIAVPKDGSIPVFTGTTLSEIALQIASYRREAMSRGRT